MPLERWWGAAQPVAGTGTVRRIVTDNSDWLSVAAASAASGGQLLALWATSAEAPTAGAPAASARPATVRAALLLDGRTLIAELECVHPDGAYRGLQSLFPAARRMQRAVRDLTGLRSDADDQRPWLRHHSWPEGFLPLQSGAHCVPVAGAADDYGFVRVAGDGVHEIAVGPVHAGIIEPGHFRFSVVGEKVLRLEERLGYVHKGVERRFTELPLLEGHRLAARVCGDSAVAYSWAYCQAVEGLAGITVPERALWLRALCLELERAQNHLGDLGALGNDAGFAFGLMQFSRLKERLLRVQSRACGQRYLLDAIVPGGVSFDPDAVAAGELAACCNATAAAAGELRQIYDEHSGLRDRFVGAGTVGRPLARRLGLTGLAARASGIAADLRVDQPCAPYAQLAPRLCVQTGGDVAARVALRFEELAESLRLVRTILAGLPAGSTRGAAVLDAATYSPGDFAIGLVEGWRGPVMIAIDAGADGRIRRCHPHDPSWQNWPALEHAVIDNIVPDFPLINKSFNFSYSGHDL